MFPSKMNLRKLTAVASLAVTTTLSGCVYPGMQHGIAACPPQRGPGTAVESLPPAIGDALARDIADAEARSQELAAELNDVRAQRDRLQDEISRMEAEQSATLQSVTTANHEVSVTRTELDRASEDIRLMRRQLQQVIDEVSNREAAHAAQMGQFLHQLDGLEYEYGGGREVKGSYPLGPSLPQKP